MSTALLSLHSKHDTMHASTAVSIKPQFTCIGIYNTSFVSHSSLHSSAYRLLECESFAWALTRSSAFAVLGLVSLQRSHEIQN